jgi:hypothetical protein
MKYLVILMILFPLTVLADDCCIKNLGECLPVNSPESRNNCHELFPGVIVPLECSKIPDCELAPCEECVGKKGKEFFKCRDWCKKKVAHRYRKPQ